jgi:hypothetical protein
MNGTASLSLVTTVGSGRPPRAARPPGIGACRPGAINLDFAGQLAFGLTITDDRPEFMSHHESRFVLAINVPPELQSGHALDRVHEDGNRGKVVADRQFPAGKDGSAGHAELVVACLAFPNPARREGIDRSAFAAPAKWLAAVVGPANCLEAGMGLIVGHPHDAGQAQGPGFRAQR